MLINHRVRVTHICVSKLTIIVTDNGLSPDRRRAIIWTNDGILLIGPLGTNFSEILIEINTFSCKKNDLKMSSRIWRLFCIGLIVLMTRIGSSNGLTQSGWQVITWTKDGINRSRWVNGMLLCVGVILSEASGKCVVQMHFWCCCKILGNAHYGWKSYILRTNLTNFDFVKSIF